jgi:hypothetical protein
MADEVGLPRVAVIGRDSGMARCSNTSTRGGTQFLDFQHDDKNAALPVQHRHCALVCK